MKTNRILTGRFLNRVWSWTIPCLILSLQLPATIRAEEPNEKAERYHSALLRRPSGDYLFDRFFNSWLDTGTIDGLGEFLDQRGDAEDATTADRLLYGYFLVKTGRESEALEIFSKALESDPENEEAWAESAKAHARTLDFETALAEIDKAITLTESDELTIELGKLKGRWQARTGESEEALKTWKALSDQFPDDDEMKEDLVDLQLGESLIEEALATQKALVEFTRDPYHKITRKLRLGDIYLRSGEQEEAKRIYQESLEASGQGTWLEKEILAQIEQLFRREDDIAGLDEFYTNLIETHPQRIALRLRQADVLAERGENEKVVESFQEILKMTPGDRDNREAYVSILGQIDMVDEAVSQMEALCESFPEDPELVTQLAAWQHRAEDREAAQKSVERFLELSDGSEYSYLRAARMLEQFDLAEAAAATFESLIAKFPESTGALDEQAAFLHRNEKVEEAIALWKKIASDGDSQDAIRAARMLSSRGERESAYQILLERAEEFSGDFVFLGRLCTEAIASGHAEEALPWVEKRLTLAESSGDLSEVIRQVNSVLRTTEKTEEYRESLRSKIDELSIHEACLLSELLDQNGEYDAATTILEPLIERGEVLAMNQRVRQLVSRNDWKPAAAEMEKIVNLPEGQRSNDIERLIDLHRRALDFDKALEWIEEWKKISPGASRPWILEANTLHEKGEVDDAILVLRQAANQFEDDDEPRTLLASYFSQQGKHEDAERIYWNLYEESEEVAAKIRWATSLAMAAEANGKVDALLEKFEERRKNNETSIAPLLSIAEIHRRTNNYEGRREALLEATRMRPEDLGLLRQIARIEESEGDWERALKTLETAATLDKTDDTKKRIALLHLRYGDEEEAYQKLFSLAGGSEMEAETVIGMTDAMIARMDWDRALTFIDEHNERFPEDYRIGYLRAVILEEAGDSETAIDAFLQLLDIDQELPSVKKQTSPGIVSYASRIEEIYGEMPEGAFEMMGWFNHRYYSYQYRNVLQSRSVRFQSNPLSGISGIVRLPNSLDELKSYTLTHINGVAQFLGKDEDLEQLESELELRGITDAAILLAVQFGDQHSSQFIVDEMMTDRFPESQSLMACFALQSGRAIQNGQVLASGDFLATISDHFEKDYPHLSLLAAMAAANAGNEWAFTSIGQQLDTNEDILELPSAVFSAASQLVLLQDINDLPGELSTRLVKTYEEWYAIQQAEYRKKNPNTNAAAAYAMYDTVAALYRKTGNFDSYVKRLEEIQEEYERSMQQFGSSASSQSGFGQYLRYINQRQPLLSPLGFPAFETPAIAGAVLSQFAKTEGIYQGHGTVPFTPEEAKELSAKTENSLLRTLFLSLTEDGEAIEAALEAVIAEATETHGRLPIREALLAAGWYQKNENWEEAMRLLESVRLKPMSSKLRQRIDASLVNCGQQMASLDSSDPALIEKSSDAALRLRYGFLTSQERGELVAALRDFGLEDQAKRLEAKGIAGQSSRSQFVPSVASGVRGLSEHLTRLVEGGKRDKATELLERSILQHVRSVAKSGGGRWDYDMLNTIRQLKSNHGSLYGKFLEAAKPGKDASTEERLQFAYLLHLNGEVVKSSEQFELALENLEGSARVRQLPAAAMIVAASSPEAGSELLAELDRRTRTRLGEFAYSAILPISYIRSDDSEFDARINQAKAVTQWLEAEAENPELAREPLEWIEPYIRMQLSSLGSELPNMFSGKIEQALEWSEFSEEKMKLRRTVHDDLCLAMMKYPQLARAGFANYSVMHVTDHEGNPFLDSDFPALARESLENHSRNAVVNSQYRNDHYNLTYRKQHTLWHAEEVLLLNAFHSGRLGEQAEAILAMLEQSRDQESRRLGKTFYEMLTSEGENFESSLRSYMNQTSTLPQSGRYYLGSQSTLAARSIGQKAFEVWKLRKEDLSDEFDVAEFLAEQIRKSKANARAEPVIFAVNWIEDIAASQSWEEAEKMILSLAENWIGKPENWDRFVYDQDARNQGSRTSGYVDIAHEQFAAFLSCLVCSPELVCQASEFIEEHGLNTGDQISRTSILNRTDWIRSFPELAMRLYKAGPFLEEIESFHAGPAGSNSTPILVEILNATQQWKDPQSKEEFSELLKNNNSFGAQLSLAYLERKEDPDKTLRFLGSYVESLRKMQGDNLSSIAMMVEAIYPKGIPRDVKGEGVDEVAKMLGAKRAASAKEAALVFLEYDSLKENGITRGYDLIRKTGDSLNTLLKAGDYDTLSQMYWHLMGLINEEQKKPNGWGSYDSAWNAHGDFLYNWLDDVENPTIGRVVLFERIVREDEEGKIAVCRMSRFSTLLKREFDRVGGKEDLEKGLTRIFTDLLEECGNDVCIETLAYTCYGVYSRFSTPDIIRVVAWADAKALEDDPLAPLAKELAMHFRRGIAQKAPVAWEKHKNKMPDPDAWQDHFFALLQSDEFPLSWKIAIAGPVARVPLERSNRELILTCARVMAQALQEDAPFNGWRFVDTIRRFNTLEVDDEWKEVAMLVDEGWKVKNKNNAKDQSTGLAWHPWDDPVRVAMHTYAKLGDRDRLNRFRKEENARNRLKGSARPTFCLVEHGHFKEALDELKQSKEFADVGLDYPSAGSDYIAFYNNRVHENIPKFLETIEEEPLRFFAEVVLRGAADLPPLRAENDAAYERRSARMGKLAARFPEIDFQGHEDLRDSLLRQLAYFDNAVWTLRNSIQEFESKPVAAFAAERNVQRIRYGMRIPAANAILDAKKGSLKTVRDHLKSHANFDRNLRYYHEEALEFFSLRIASGIRNRGQSMPAQEVQTCADALHLLLSVPSRDILMHTQLNICIVNKIAADAIAAGHDDVESQLKTREFNDQRLEILSRHIASGNGNPFWVITAGALKVAASNPDARPDDETRRAQIERVLHHPLAKELLKKEKDAWTRMVSAKWVREDEKDTEWAKELMKSIQAE